jgi:hypothetical protein
MTGSDHPFLERLNEMASEELERKHSELLNRFRIARSMNMHPEVMNQIDLMLNSIEAERIKRASLEEEPTGVVLDTDPIVIPKFNPYK